MTPMKWRVTPADTLRPVKHHTEALRLAKENWESAIRKAVKTYPKVDVAKAAGISRPTLDKILNR